MTTPKRPVALMTAAQVLCIAAMLATILSPFLIGDHLGRFLFVPCLLLIEAEAIRICQRMKKSSAFSLANVASLGRIMWALLIAGVLLLYFGQFVMDFLLDGLPEVQPGLRWGLPSFTVLTLAVMVRAVQVLMRRALDMQEEADLTV